MQAGGFKSADQALRQMSVSVLRGDEHILAITGTFLRVLEADNPFQISFDGGTFMDGGKALAWTFGADDLGNQHLFRQVRIKAPADVDITATIIYGFGLITDSRVNFVAGTSVLDVRETQAPRRKPLTVAAATEFVIAGAATTTIAAAAANYRHVIVQNAGAEIVKLREDGGTAGKGITLNPGERIDWPTSAALEAENLNPTAANVAIVNVLTSEETA